jgi:hypothetical protein
MRKKVFMFAWILVFSLCVSVYAEDNNGYINPNYGKITNDVGWKDVVQRVDKHIIPNRVIMGYMSMLLNKDDLIQLAKSGELDNDKSKFILENTHELRNFMYYMLITTVINTLNPAPTDAEYMYITGVINDTHAQAATTGPEYEAEKMLFSQVPIYNIWEMMRKDGTYKTIVSEQLDNCVNSLNK